MFSPSNYAGVRQALEQANTLPPHCYTQDEFFERETQRIFSKAWHFAGRIDELRHDPGDGVNQRSPGSRVLVVDTVAGSALVSLTPDGELRAFYNACRHRGTRLLDSSECLHHLKCPYHSWTYGLDGSLLAAPGMQDVNGFSNAAYGLEAVRVDQWGGFVFICFNDNAPSLREWIGDLPDYMSSHSPGDVRCVRRTEYEIDSNWKFLIENALEAYHTGTVHHATLGAQRSASISAKGWWDALYVPSDDASSLATLPGEAQGLPFIESLSGPAKAGTYFSVIYPCTQIVFAQDCIWWLDIKPVSAQHSRLTLGACFPKSTLKLDQFDACASAYFDRWDRATPEDNAIAELQQRGCNSGATLPGRYAAQEHCVHRLNNWILDCVLDD